MGHFPKRVVSAGLEPIGMDRDGWVREYRHTTLLNRRGVEVRYSGSVLTASAGTGHSIQFMCRTTALRRARIRIPFCINSETVVKVTVAGKLVRTAEFVPAADGRLTVRLCVADVTRWTESTETSQIQLRFSYGGEQHTPLILMGEEQPLWRALLLQRWTLGYAWTATLYFVLAWASILALAVVILANLRIQNEMLRTYAVVGTCAMWIAGLLGLPDLARIPVRTWIRRLFGATRSEAGGFLRSHSRGLVIGILASVFIVSASLAQEVVRCYWVRQQYASLVRQGLRPTDEISPAAIRALKRVPWRPEAQILVERSVFDARREGKQEVRFRWIAASLAKEPGVEAAIRTAPPRDQLPSYLDGSSPVLSNPVVWYASIIIEGEGFREDKLVGKAMELLRSSHDRESKLVLDNLEIIREKDGDLQEQKVKNLERWLEHPVPQSTLESTHSYLAACDMLMGYHLAGCEKEAASTWLKRELSARDTFRERHETLWLRPPEKFLAYYMFALYGSLTNGNVDPENDAAKRVRRLTFRKDCDFRQEFQAIASTYSQFANREGWEKGTQLEIEDLDEYLEKSLSKGWRY